MKTVELGGVRYPWREVLKARREQQKAARQRQLTLFELKEDTRPASQKNAGRRFTEPLLFKD